MACTAVTGPTELLRRAVASPRRTVAGVLAAALLGGAITVMVAWPGRSSPVEATSGPVTFTVDGALRPSAATVAPVEGRTEQRSVGVLAAPDGASVELVRDEVIVHVAGYDELDAFLARWDATGTDGSTASAG